MSRSPFMQDLLDRPKITTQEFSCLGVQVEGSITAGKITVKGSISGRSGVSLPIEDANTSAGIPADTGITTAGIYRMAVAGLGQAELIYSDDFAYTGVLYVTGYVSATLPPPYIFSGG